jgi:tricorn protease
VPLAGGVAQRLTSNLSEESRAAVSSDGKWVAFSAGYDGPSCRWKAGAPAAAHLDGTNAFVRGWTPDFKVLSSPRLGVQTRRHDLMAGAVRVETVEGRALDSSAEIESNRGPKEGESDAYQS